MKRRLDYKKDLLCVLVQYEVLHAHTQTSMKEWYPIREATESEVATLLGRPLKEVDADEGIYIDEEGNVFELTEKGATKPIEVERIFRERKAAEERETVGSLKERRHRRKSKHRRGAQVEKGGPQSRRSGRTIRGGPFSEPHGADRCRKVRSALKGQLSEPIAFAQLNLRQKLAEVRRRIGYVQKRGHNERFNYSYVTAADIAGSVGDILAELGVVVIPSLEEHHLRIGTGPRRGHADGSRGDGLHLLRRRQRRRNRREGRGPGTRSRRQGAVQGDDRSLEVRPAPIIPAGHRRRPGGGADSTNRLTAHRIPIARSPPKRCANSRN